MNYTFKTFGCLLTLILIMSSCSVQKFCEKNYPCQTIVKDSIITKEKTVIRDTTIYVKVKGETVHDTTRVEIPVQVPGKPAPLPQSKPLTKESKFAKATAQVIDGVLNLTFQDKDTTLEFQLKGVIQERDRYNQELQQVKVREPVNSWFDHFIWGFVAGIITLIILLYVMIKLKK
jgi:hypothetical protein